MNCPRPIRAAWLVACHHSEAVFVLFAVGVQSVPLTHLSGWKLSVAAGAVALVSWLAKGLMPRDAALAEVRSAAEWAGDPASVPEKVERPKPPESPDSSPETPPPAIADRFGNPLPPKPVPPPPPPPAKSLPAEITIYLHTVKEPPKKRKKK